MTDWVQGQPSASPSVAVDASAAVDPGDAGVELDVGAAVDNGADAGANVSSESCAWPLDCVPN